MAERGSETSESGTPSLVRHEEELVVLAEPVEVGRLRVRKHVESEPVAETYLRNVEQGEVERAPAGEGDSGQIEMLPDGSVSVPVLEEEIVVTKRVVVRERLIIRKRTVVEEHRVETELRTERIEVEAEGDVEIDAG